MKGKNTNRSDVSQMQAREGLTSESANKTPISRMDKAIKRLTKDELEEYLRDVTLSLLYRDEYIGAKYIEMMEYDAEGRK